MTIIEAIDQVDELVPNTYDEVQKITWLSRLDGRIKAEIIDTHEGGEGVAFAGYREDTSVETELLVKAPYDNVYPLWLEAQIHYADGEANRYNNTSAMFDAEYASMANHYNRTHMPKSKKFQYY